MVVTYMTIVLHIERSLAKNYVMYAVELHLKICAK